MVWAYFFLRGKRKAGATPACGSILKNLKKGEDNGKNARILEGKSQRN